MISDRKKGFQALHDSDLEQVSGGVTSKHPKYKTVNKKTNNTKLMSTTTIAGNTNVSSQNEQEQTMGFECPSCHEVFQINVQLPSCRCPNCQALITMDG
ncbi:MAG: zinc-ribbon domain-containing protein [Lachnospiraceae bacterium]|nr:zinc-ribbon domain-containing protein [Lachnospiraceae bacterium]